MIEYLDIVDENDNLTGIIKEKQQAHRDGDYHRTAHIWLLNEKKELLLQRRSPQKSSFPDYWDISAAGHIRCGESVIQGAIRELKEELGVDSRESDYHYITRIRFESPCNNEFGYVYLLKTKLKENEFVFRDHEVAEVKYVHYTLLEQMVKDKVDRLIIHKNEEELLFDYIRSNLDK